MKNLNFKLILSAVIIYSIMAAVTAKAAPVHFNQVIQVVNAKPGKANTGGFAKLRLVGDDLILTGAKDGGDEPKTDTPAPQDDRVITEIRAEIVEEDVCDCAALPPVGGGFPKYALLGLGAVPLLFLIPNGNDDNPTPTPTQTPTQTQTPQTPTPPTEPVPEPMTILLFGTGLASIGIAARKKFGRKDEDSVAE